MHIRSHLVAAFVGLMAALGSAPVSASAAPAPTVAGTYRASFRVGTSVRGGTLTVTATGNWKLATAPAAVSGTWTAGATGVYSFRETRPSTCVTFAGRPTVSGIDSRANPGPFQPCGGPAGSWYAVRI